VDKYQFIAKHQAKFTAKTMLRVLGVAPSGYYKWCKKEESKTLKNELRILKLILIEFKNSNQKYGSPKITKAIKKKGLKVNHKCIERIMRKYGITPDYRVKFKKRTTNSKHKYEISANLLEQNFHTTRPNEVWVSDITYVETLDGWFYLCVIIDLYARKVIGWAFKKRITKNLVLKAFRMAWLKRKPPKDRSLIFHSDRGSQYCSKAFRQELKVKRILQSMSGKGNCFDNAPAESFFGLLKREELNLHLSETSAVVRRRIFYYIEVFYNKKRLHSYLDYCTPEEFEKRAAA
jgi:transposase InsO family protein